MINGLLNGMMTFVIGLISILLYPIDTVINTTFPQFSDMLTGFGSFIDKILEVIPWVLSWFHIPVWFLIFVVGYIVAKATSSLVVHEVKIILAWYRKIMP